MAPVNIFCVSFQIEKSGAPALLKFSWKRFTQCGVIHFSGMHFIQSEVFRYRLKCMRLYEGHISCIFPASLSLFFFSFLAIFLSIFLPSFLFFPFPSSPLFQFLHLPLSSVAFVYFLLLVTTSVQYLIFLQFYLNYSLRSVGSSLTQCSISVLQSRNSDSYYKT